jgi:fluoride exporter
VILKLAFIAVGGAFGSVCRFLLHTAVQRLVGMSFPAGTLAVNVLGCLLVGFLAASLGRHLPLREELRLGILVGILGGFTTFSTFGIETYELAAAAQARLAAANVILSCGLGLAAVWLGVNLAERWFAAP